jgi:nucleotide-binding universal stress UspA family protein
MFHKVLVPIDFSKCSQPALDTACFIARRFQATLQLLYIWEPRRYVVPEAMVNMPGQPSRPLVDLARQRAGEQMSQVIAALRAQGCTVEGRSEVGFPTERIVEIAAEEGFDLIVIGTHGRTGLSHLLMGSVTEKVVRHAHCPVLTVRPAYEDPER